MIYFEINDMYGLNVLLIGMVISKIFTIYGIGLVKILKLNISTYLYYRDVKKLAK